MSGAETVVVTRKHEDVACDCIAEWQSSKSGFAPHGSFTEAGKVIARFEAEVTRATQSDALAVLREAEGALAGAIPALEQDHEQAKEYGDADWEGIAYQRLQASETTLANLRAAIARAGGA
jgi:hypothetical protein